MKSVGIDMQGGKGMAGFSIDCVPKLSSLSHGTPQSVSYGWNNVNIRVKSKEGISVRCVMDMGGGKAGIHVSDGSVSPTLIKGRSSVNDIHVICYGTRT